MESSAPTIFISYSRSDGRAFAEDFERRLEDKGIRSWRDLRSVEGGEDIRPQVLRAIEQAKHLVLILTRRALASDWVKREWTHARMVGRKVSPVLADQSIKPSDLPSWIRRADVYDITDPEPWAMLVQVLKGPGETRRVPYMSGDARPFGYVPRPAEYDALKEAVLSAKGDGTVALTTALRGAGGYGKTTLANELCRDPDVRFEFSDGILRVDVGKERSDVTGLVVDLIEKLDPEAKRPGFQDVRTAAEHLSELIGEARLLLVIDDVWREAQLRPFLVGGPNCVRLVTTRLPLVLPAAHTPVRIDEMRVAEAVSLICVGLPIEKNPAARGRLVALAKRLGFMAQMLAIANSWIRNRILTGELFSATIKRFEERLEKRGLIAFDPEDEPERSRAIRACIEVSLEDLIEDDAARLGELAILPEDEDVPLAVVEALWQETGGLDEDETDDLVNRLHALSLLQNFDLGTRTLRLHDNMIWYLRGRIGSEGCSAAHEAIVSAIRKACAGNWGGLPTDHAYGWRFLIRHLRGAGQDAEADRLLTDYAWIKAKLAASGPQGLLADYLPEPSDPGAQLVGRAIALSVPTVTASPRELALQLFGRLGYFEDSTVVALVMAACQDADFYPIPRWPGLTSPGAERLRLVGHQQMIFSATFSLDGAQIVTISDDGTARLWNTATGAEITVLGGHETDLISATFSPDGTCIVTSSYDRTAKLWNTTTGAEIAVFHGHEDAVNSAAFSFNGTRVITSSEDSTVRLWNAATGSEIAVLRGHEAGVNSAAFSSDSTRVITSSDDGTTRLWETAIGAEIAVLLGQEGEVTSAAFSSDGTRVVTSSDDGTARLWEAVTGDEIAVLLGHKDGVNSAAFSPDGTHVVTASNDHTVRLWDAATGIELSVFREHQGRVFSAAFSPDGNRIVTASQDRTARVWDATGIELAAPRGHRGQVICIALSPDGTRVITSSDDGTTILWDGATGANIAELHGYEGVVVNAIFSPNSTRIVTSSDDGTAQLWNSVTGAEIAVPRKLRGQVTCAAFSDSGIHVVIATSDGESWLWNDVTGVKLAEFRGHRGQITCAAFSPNGTQVVTSSYDRTARVWNATTGAEVAALRGHEGVVISAAFSPNGTRILTVSKDKTARLWDTSTGVGIAIIPIQRSQITYAAFSRDGTRVITSSDDAIMRLWNATSGAEIAAACGHADVVSSAAFSFDGSRVVIASQDYMVRVWNAITGTEIAVLHGHEDEVNRATFSPDGTLIVTSSYDCTVRMWDAAIGTEVARITLDAAATALAIQGDLIALGDALGRVHVLTADKLLNGKN